MSVDEWNGMGLQVTKNNTETNANNSSGDVAAPVPVSFGTDAAGKSVDDRRLGGRLWHRPTDQWVWAQRRHVDADRRSADQHVRRQRHTYVLADLPRTSPPAPNSASPRRARPRDRGVHRHRPALDRTFAGYTFSETGLYTGGDRRA